VLVQPLPSERLLTTSGKWPESLLILQPWSLSLFEPRWPRGRFRWLLVSRIVTGNDRERALTDILIRWSRGSGRGSGGPFTSTRLRGTN